MLDAVGPLVHILEEASAGKLTMQNAQMSLRLLGNASMNARRRNIIQDLNPNLLEMSEDNNLFTKAAPLLLGEGFSKKQKKETKSANACLRQLLNANHCEDKTNSFFDQAAPKTIVPKTNTHPVVAAKTSGDGEAGTSTGTTRIQRTQGNVKITRSDEPNSKDYINFTFHSIPIIRNKKLSYQPYDVPNSRKPIEYGHKTYGSKNSQESLTNSRKNKHGKIWRKRVFGGLEITIIEPYSCRLAHVSQ